MIDSGVLPRWLGWVSILAGILFFLQGFGLGGVITTLGSFSTSSGWILLIFVLVQQCHLAQARKHTVRRHGRNPVSRAAYAGPFAGTDVEMTPCMALQDLWI